MKKLVTSIVVMLSVVGSSFSQGIVIKDLDHHVVTGAVIYVSLLPSSSAINEFLVNNTNANSGSYKVRRFILTMDAGDATQFCWGGTCYGFGTDISTYNQGIAAGDSVNFSQGGFHSDFISGPANVIRKVYYKVYNTNTSFPADTAGFTIQYNPTAAGIDEQVLAGTISNVYPNPASSFTSVKYDVSAASQKARIVIYNMLGKQVKEITLTDKQGTAKIATDDLTSGVYFYSLIVDDKSISTHKIVVSH